MRVTRLLLIYLYSDGVFTWKPPSLDVSRIEIIASDGRGGDALLSLNVKVCHCANDGGCDFNSIAAGQDLENNGFAVSK